MNPAWCLCVLRVAVGTFESLLSSNCVDCPPSHSMQLHREATAEWTHNSQVILCTHLTAGRE